MLNPHYIVGFVDGEGCFCISLNRNGSRLPEVRLIFEIELREDDEPFFQQYSLQAKKRLDFERFCNVAELMKDKQHLTPQGVRKIHDLKRKDSLDALDAHVQWGATEIT